MMKRTRPKARPNPHPTDKLQRRLTIRIPAAGSSKRLGVDEVSEEEIFEQEENEMEEDEQDTRDSDSESNEAVFWIK